MQELGLEYLYCGHFTLNLTESILSFAENKLVKNEETGKVNKKTYFIMVESLQNITRHQKEQDKEVFFALQKLNENTVITSGNYISAEEVNPIKEKIEKINSLTTDELKNYYMETLQLNSLSDKGGAGLGLIEMARKSRNKLVYDFVMINPEYHYFYFQTNICSNVNNSVCPNTITQVKEIHEKISEAKIKLMYQGLFSQESLLEFIKMFENTEHSKSELSIQKKNIHILIELLQNISLHGLSLNNNKNEKPGIYTVGGDKNICIFTTGNFIENNKIDTVKNKIDYTNSLNSLELEELYDKTLLNPPKESIKGAGLGFIDMRLKTHSKINYCFDPINDSTSFFTVQLSIVQ